MLGSCPRTRIGTQPLPRETMLEDATRVKKRPWNLDEARQGIDGAVGMLCRASMLWCESVRVGWVAKMISDVEKRADSLHCVVVAVGR